MELKQSHLFYVLKFGAGFQELWQLICVITDLPAPLVDVGATPGCLPPAASARYPPIASSRSRPSANVALWRRTLTSAANGPWQQ